jgi:hypothetical protein
LTNSNKEIGVTSPPPASGAPREHPPQKWLRPSFDRTMAATPCCHALPAASAALSSSTTTALHETARTLIQSACNGNLHKSQVYMRTARILPSLTQKACTSRQLHTGAAKVDTHHHLVPDRGGDKHTSLERQLAATILAGRTPPLVLQEPSRAAMRQRILYAAHFPWKYRVLPDEAHMHVTSTSTRFPMSRLRQGAVQLMVLKR